MAHKPTAHKSMAHKPTAHKPMAHKSMAHKSTTHKPTAHKSTAHKSMAHKSMTQKPTAHKITRLGNAACGENRIGGRISSSSSSNSRLPPKTIWTSEKAKEYMDMPFSLYTHVNDIVENRLSKIKNEKLEECINYLSTDDERSKRVDLYREKITTMSRQLDSFFEKVQKLKNNKDEIMKDGVYDASN